MSAPPQKKRRELPAAEHWVTEHWNQFYAGGAIPKDSSSFARHVTPLLSKEHPLIELGCGNGRDAFYFAEQGGFGVCVVIDGAGFSVFGVDLSDVAISTDQQREREKHKSKLLNPHFIRGDITDLPAEGFENHTRFGTVYCRFTLHAISAAGETRLLKWALEHLVPGGVVVAESRSVKSDLYGQGVPVPGDRDAFVHGGGGAGDAGHFRRFQRVEVITAKLEEIGFVVEQMDEQNGVAKYGDDDPVVIRFVARKP